MAEDVPKATNINATTNGNAHANQYTPIPTQKIEITQADRAKLQLKHQRDVLEQTIQKSEQLWLRDGKVRPAFVFCFLITSVSCQTVGVYTPYDSVRHIGKVYSSWLYVY